jgi:murein DD-endopeptidase MepM/ murein hydrolase activator NlpD
MSSLSKKEAFMLAIVLFLGWILSGGREIIVPQGGVKLVPIQTVSLPEFVSARLDTYKVPIVRRNDSMFVLVSADLEMKPGKYFLRLLADAKLLDSCVVGVEKTFFPQIKLEKKYYQKKRIPTHADTVAQMHLIKYRNTLKETPSAIYAQIYSLVNPLDSLTLTSEFGKRRIFPDKQYSHGGADLHALLGTKVFAIGSGNVVWAENDTLPANGVTTVLDLGGNIRIFSLHLSKVVVKTGDIVKKGQLLGFSGSTGNSFDPHLHFEVHCGRARVDPLILIKTFR